MIFLSSFLKFTVSRDWMARNSIRDKEGRTLSYDTLSLLCAWTFQHLLLSILYVFLCLAGFQAEYRLSASQDKQQMLQSVK